MFIAKLSLMYTDVGQHNTTVEPRRVTACVWRDRHADNTHNSMLLLVHSEARK